MYVGASSMKPGVEGGVWTAWAWDAAELEPYSFVGHVIVHLQLAHFEQFVFFFFHCFVLKSAPLHWACHLTAEKSENQAPGDVFSQAYSFHLSVKSYSHN